MPCSGCGKGRQPTGTVYNPYKFQAEALPNGEHMMVICTSPQQGTRSMNSRAVPGKKYLYKQGTILTLEIGDEWVAQHKDFERFIPEEEMVAKELPKEPPTVEKLALPVKGPVPVTVRKSTPHAYNEVRENPDGMIERITSAEPVHIEVVSIDALDISDSLKDKLSGSDFADVDAIKNDIVFNKGRGLLDIPGVGKAALVKIQAAVFG